MSDPIATRHVAAVQFVRDACRFALDSFSARDFKVTAKDDASPVTKTDRRAERMLRDAIAAEFPQDAILGEEFGETPGSSGYRWVLDPIDGTRPFIHGAPLWGTLAAVLHEDRPVLGVCGVPGGELFELYHGRQSGEAGYVGGVFNSKGYPARKFPTEAPRAAKLSEATVLYTQIDLFERLPLRKLLDTLVERCRLVRGWGDCWGHMAVADGRADLMIDPQMNLWDAAALLPIVEASGACYRTLTNECRIDQPSGISLTPQLENEFFTLVSECGLTS